MISGRVEHSSRKLQNCLLVFKHRLRSSVESVGGMSEEYFIAKSISLSLEGLRAQHWVRI